MSLGSNSLLWLLPVACLHALGACSTDVEVFRAAASRTAGAAGATSSQKSDNSSVLIAPASVPKTSDGNCQPGHYVGAFSGTYYSAVWLNGSEPLSIAATPSLGRPGLEFWLEQIPRNCRVDDEFCADFTLKGGKIRGFANPFSNVNAPANSDTDNAALVAIRFEIDFGGELDCTRGQFRGLLQNGCYDFATMLFRFEGTAPGTYDPASVSFTDGQWMVKEMPAEDAWVPPDANIGGMGSWQAALANDHADPVAEGGGLCDH